MDALIDTNVVVDIYRGLAPATDWIRANPGLRIGISPYAWLETVEGAKSKVEQAQILRLLKRFELLEFSQSELEWSKRKLLQYGPSHGVDFPDCLIAASSFRLQLPIYTRNIKHFRPLLGSLALEPYKDSA
jgi:hypothetical protein